MADTRKSRFTEDEMVGFIKEAEDRILMKVVCRKGGFIDETVYKWLAKYCGMDVNRPGFELTPRSWTNFKGCNEEVSN